MYISCGCIFLTSVFLQVYGVPYALEFIMQLYEVDPYASNSNETIATAAQAMIWHRLIDVVLNHIYDVNLKSLNE